MAYNPFTFSDNKKLKHFAIEPEARYWLCAPFAGHFVGADLLYTHYNAGGIKLPFGIYPDLADYRFQGDLGAVGLVYGYSWMLPNKRWSIEGVVGLGFGLTHYTQYACAVCGMPYAAARLASVRAACLCPPGCPCLLCTTSSSYTLPSALYSNR